MSSPSEVICLSILLIQGLDSKDFFKKTSMTETAHRSFGLKPEQSLPVHLECLFSSLWCLQQIDLFCLSFLYDNLDSGMKKTAGMCSITCYLLAILKDTGRVEVFT